MAAIFHPLLDKHCLRGLGKGQCIRLEIYYVVGSSLFKFIYLPVFSAFIGGSLIRICSKFDNQPLET